MGCNMGVYLGASVYNESQVTPEWVHDEIEKNGKGVFFATYGVTTFNEILQEYNNGKIIVCKYQPVTPGETTIYYFNLVRFNTETFDFVGVMQDGTIYRTGVNVNEGWENVTSFKSDEIEFIEYNVDSYSTIKSHYDNGKFIVLKYREQTPLVTKYCFYPLVSVDETNKEIVFGSLELGQNNKKITFTVTDSTGWAARAETPAVAVDVALDPTSHNPVENMAIAAELTAINNKITGDLNDIFLALASKGVTVPAGAGLDDVAGLIDTVPTGSPEPIENPNYKTCLYLEKVTDKDLRISTSVSIDLNDEIEIKFSLNSSLNGADYGSYGVIFNFIYLINDGFWCIGYNSGNIVFSGNHGFNKNVVLGATLSAGVINVIKIKKDRVIFNGAETLISVFGSSNNYEQMPDMGYNQNIITKYYEIKIKDENGKTKNRLVAAERLADNAAGLYDVFTGAFYTDTSSSYQGSLGPEMPL